MLVVVFSDIFFYLTNFNEIFYHFKVINALSSEIFHLS